MAEYDDNYDNYEGDSESLVKDLRKQLKQLSKEKSELSQELQSVQSQQREQKVSSILESKGISTKVAKFIPEDLLDEDGIASWLEENGDLFGAAPVAAETVDTPNSAERSSADRLRSLSENASTPSKVDDIAAKLANAQSDDEINAIWADARNYFL